MLNYRDTQNALHTRLLDFSPQEYLFVLLTILGEDPRVAYASVFDAQDFKRNVPSENEEEYLGKKKHEAQVMLEQQQCVHLKEYLEDQYRSEVQSAASTLKDYKFTGGDVQKLLNNLLKDRSEDLSEASVRDILALIKSMYDSGALDSGDAFEKHFITVPKKYDALCPSCNHELYAVEGLDIVCSNCGTRFRWSEEEQRFYPKMGHL